MRPRKMIVVFAWGIVPLCLMAWSAALPKLFVVGDSISMHYGAYLPRYLEGSLEVDRKRDDGGSSDESVPDGANGGDSGMVLAYLRTKLADPKFRPDVLMLNCGLHDIKIDVKTRQHQVPIKRYESNLKEIAKLVGDRRIRMIWVRTTEVVDSIHNKRGMKFTRHAADVEAYNAVADKVFKRANIPVIDLHVFTKSLSDDRFVDHVHYNEETRRLQAAYLAGWLEAWFSKLEKGDKH